MPFKPLYYPRNVPVTLPVSPGLCCDLGAPRVLSVLSLVVVTVELFCPCVPSPHPFLPHPPMLHLWLL